MKSASPETTASPPTASPTTWHIHPAKRALLIQHGPDVPGDGFAFAIRVGREVEGLGAFQGLDEGGLHAGARADALDPSIDYQFHACSGARTENLLPYGTRNPFGLAAQGQYGERSQLDRVNKRIAAGRRCWDGVVGRFGRG